MDVRHGFDMLTVIKRNDRVDFFFPRCFALFSPVGGYFHVSGHLLCQQPLVVITLLPHLLLQVNLLAFHFIYSSLGMHMHTKTR